MIAKAAGTLAATRHAQAAGRYATPTNFEEPVKLIAVSKFHDVSAIAEVLDAGHRFFGENRVQEAQVK